MASDRSKARLEALIRVLVFGGLLTGVLGLATRPLDPATGWVLIVAGFGVAAVGALLVWVRSRMTDDPPA